MSKVSLYFSIFG